MIVDPMLALFSDRLFMATVGVYVLAMALHSAEYAAARSPRPTPAPRPTDAAVPATAVVRTALSHAPS
ncbi:MAG: hypothetical protein ACRDRK_02905, partial [Pseudonocardia sp.]